MKAARITLVLAVVVWAALAFLSQLTPRERSAPSPIVEPPSVARAPDKPEPEAGEPETGPKADLEAAPIQRERTPAKIEQPDPAQPASPRSLSAAEIERFMTRHGLIEQQLLEPLSSATKAQEQTLAALVLLHAAVSKLAGEESDVDFGAIGGDIEELKRLLRERFPGFPKNWPMPADFPAGVQGELSHRLVYYEGGERKSFLPDLPQHDAAVERLKFYEVSLVRDTNRLVLKVAARRNGTVHQSGMVPSAEGQTEVYLSSLEHLETSLSQLVFTSRPVDAGRNMRADEILVKGDVERSRSSQPMQKMVSAYRTCAALSRLYVATRLPADLLEAYKEVEEAYMRVRKERCKSLLDERRAEVFLMGEVWALLLAVEDGA